MEHKVVYSENIILGPTQNGDLRVFLPDDSGSSTGSYSFSETIRAEKRKSHPFA